MDPDPGGPKTCGSGGSGTQPKTFRIQIRFRMRNTDSNLDIFSGELPPGIVHEDFPHCISYLRRIVAATHEPYKPKDTIPALILFISNKSFKKGYQPVSNICEELCAVLKVLLSLLLRKIGKDKNKKSDFRKEGRQDQLIFFYFVSI
jgi:hypothetical protein